MKAKSGRIRAVTFDVGGTLIECRPSVGHIYAEVAARHGHHEVSPVVLNQKFKIAWNQFPKFNHSPAHWAALVDAIFEGLVDPLPSRTFFPALYDRFCDADVWHVFKDVTPTLEALKGRGLTLGIISNWDARLRPLLKLLELDHYFQSITVSREIGAHKPRREIFEAACAALQVPPEETLHVGDSLEMDVQGARGFGMEARWLQRGQRKRESETIGSLRELDKL